MTKPIARDPIYRKRAFDADIIENCVRWYITYRLSYRDLVEIMAERGVRVAHSTILRWVTRYVPEFEKRWSRFSKAVGTSWRVDETYVSIKAKWHYLYRASRRHRAPMDDSSKVRRQLRNHEARAPVWCTKRGEISVIVLHHFNRPTEGKRVAILAAYDR
jgi:transposase-like protein